MTPSPSPARTRLRLAVVAIFLAGIALRSALQAPGSVAAPPPPSGHLVMSSQTPAIRSGGDFDLNVHVDSAEDPTRLEIATRIYPAVATRSEFQLTVTDRLVGFPLATLPPVPLSSGVVVGNDRRDLRVRIPVQDPLSAPDVGRISLGRKDGVYPVRVELRGIGDGPVLDQITTHLVYLPSEPGTPLEVAMVIPVHSPPAPARNGTRRVRPLEDLAAAARVLDKHPDLPLSVAPTPDTVAALATSSDENAVDILNSLRKVSASHQLITGAYVPVSLPALLGSNLNDEVDAQLTRGNSVLAETLRNPPDGRTWLSEEPLDQSSLALLRRRGFDRLIVTDAGLGTIRPQKLTLTRPYLLEGSARQEAATVDTDLVSHFDGPGDPVLRGHQMLADLAVLYLDQPGSGPRGVVAVPPRSWRPDSQFLDTVLTGLGESPVLQPVTLDTFFNGVSPGRASIGPQPGHRGGARQGSSADEANLRSARHRLDALASVIDPASPVYQQLSDALLIAESVDLRSARQRDPYVERTQRGVTREFRAIQVPQGGSITLTAARGEIPVTFRNQSGHPAHVVVRVQSDKLVFPHGSEFRMDLLRPNTTERLAVEARTSGSFPLLVTVESPVGNQIIGKSHLTVRSTATSGLGLGMSIGAALFLALWWGRQIVRGRGIRRPMVSPA